MQDRTAQGTRLDAQAHKQRQGDCARCLQSKKKCLPPHNQSRGLCPVLMCVTIQYTEKGGDQRYAVRGMGVCFAPYKNIAPVTELRSRFLPHSTVLSDLSLSAKGPFWLSRTEATLPAVSCPIVQNRPACPSVQIWLARGRVALTKNCAAQRL